MTRPDLRALFRSNAPELSAHEVFANREDEWEAVVRSVVDRAEEVAGPGFDVQDLETPRRNILVFYGVGGIGKTEFSRNVVAKLAADTPEAGPQQWPALPPVPARVLPVRIDLAHPSGTDFETMMLAIRLTIGRLGAPMPAFDLALRRWWDKNHPGQPLADYLHRSRLLSRFTGAVDLPAQMESVLSDVAQALLLPGTIGGVVGQGLRTVVKALREHRQHVRLLARCRRLPDLLEAEPDLETLSYFAHLLAWDLSQLPREHRTLPVIVIDTFEDVGDRTHREMERLIQRVVWLMPNALFVVAGRNRLPWDDPRLEGQLDWAGPAAWPLLAAGAARDPRQHRIGYLSALDCENYLCRRIVQAGHPLMDEETRRLVITHSHGLPLYLDLAVMRFLDLYRQHAGHPRSAEFNYDFPALVARTFRDISPEERQVLRSVTLLDSFSIELATSAAGFQRDAPALQLVERPFIDQEAAAPFPYRLHDLVRSAIRETDSTTEDRWSEADWGRAAGRTLAALGEEFRRVQAGGDRQVLLSCLRQGIRICRDFRLDTGWLVDAAFAYVEDSVWEPIDLGVTADEVVRPPEALAAVLHSVAGRQHTHRQHTADQLRRVLESGCLPAGAEELARYHLAECHRDLGHPEESARGMRAVAAGGGRLAGRAARGLVHISRRFGRFPDVLAAAEELGPDGRRQRVLGDLWWTQGDIAAACAAYAAGRDEAAAQAHHGESALSQACLAFAAGFQDSGRAAEQIDRAWRMLRGADIRWAVVQTTVAELLRDAGRDPGLPARVASAVDEAVANGLTSSVAYARLAGCFHAAVLDDADLITSARAALGRCVSGAEFAYLVEISYFMTATPPPDALPRAQWIDGPDRTAERWLELVAGRRRQLRAVLPQ